MTHIEAMHLGAAWCYYVPDDSRYDDKYVPSLVVENVPGHCPMLGNGEGAAPWYWGNTLSEARQTCIAVNERRGISRERAQEIVLSSMMAAFGVNKAGAK